MNSISLCMIVKNEDSTLARCLDSVKKLVDEIIIVDTGSTDNTIEVAKKFTDKIYNFCWINDFAAARNYAFSKASSEYILWLDADEVMPTKTLNKLLQLKKSTMSADTYMLQNYAVIDSNGKPTFVFYRERILRNCDNAIWSGCIHECIAPFGIIERLPLGIEHHPKPQKDSNRNIKIFEQIKSTRPLLPRETYYYGRELFDHKKYTKAAKVLNDFVSSGKGWVENVIDACYIIAICYNHQKKYNKAINILLHTLTLDEPRANICCMIGDYFLLQSKYLLSIYWYQLSTKSKDVTHKGAFVDKTFYGYYPYMQMTVAYYRLSDITKAEYYNTKAGKINYTDAVRYNAQLFNEINNQKNK